MQDSAWEAAEEAERKPARTRETIPVPAPSGAVVVSRALIWIPKLWKEEE